MQRYNNTVVSPTGQAIAGANVTVTVAAIPPGTGPAASVFGDDGITPVSNIVVADSLGRFGFFIPDGKYDLLIAGGIPTITIPYILAAVEIVDLLEFNTLDAQPITVQTLNLTQVTTGNLPAAGTINLYSKNVDKRLYYQDETGTEIGPLVTTGGSSSPGGLSGDIQKNNGAGLFAPGAINDNGSIVKFSENTTQRGPNQGVDIGFFGARPINNSAIPTTVATTTSGLNTATFAGSLGGPFGFLVGDGVAIVGAGAPQSMATPAAPTITPGAAAGLTGLGYIVPLSGGSTTYTYSIAMVDANLGITAATTVTINNGPASLGVQTTPITSIASGTGNVFTVTVGSTANMVVGCTVILKGSNNDAEFGGIKAVASIVDGTHFTFVSGVDASRGISTTTATGGICSFFLCNHISLPTPTAGGLQYLIYGRQSGSQTVLNLSYPATLGFTDSSYNTWDDYGSPMSDNFTLPWWAPPTPPSTPINDVLSTTITNIAGTTVTLAIAAGTSTSGTATFDCAPAIRAAAAASAINVNSGGGTVRIPPILANSFTLVNFYVISSPISLSGALIQDGPVLIRAMVQMSGAWEATNLDAGRFTTPPGSLRGLLPVTVSGASPGIWLKGGGLRGINVSVLGNGAVGVFNTGGLSQFFENCTFAATSPQDYTSVGFYDFHQSNGAAFGFIMRNCSFSAGTPQADVSLTPLFISKFNTEVNVDYCAGNRRLCFAFVAGMNGFSHSVNMGQEVQGNIVPMVATICTAPGNTSGYLILKQLWSDTSWYPFLANLGLIGCSHDSDILYIGGNQPQSSGVGGSFGPLLSGSPFFGSVHIQANFATRIAGSGASFLGQNSNIIYESCSQNFTATTRIPGLKETAIFYNSNHTLVGNEAAAIATATLTFTIPTTLDNQAWDIFSQAGTTTLAVSAGTLFGNGTTGSFVVPNGRGVRVIVRGGNAYALGM